MARVYMGEDDFEIHVEESPSPAGPVNTDYNPHEPWPIEPLCCSFHYPVNRRTE